MPVSSHRATGCRALLFRIAVIALLGAPLVAHGQQGRPAPAGGVADGGQRTPQATQPVRLPQTPAAVHNPFQPRWIPLSAEHEKYLDEILNYWEYRSSQIRLYRCDFTRWQYDPVYVAPDPKTGELPAKEISKGVIKYERPDKAMYQDETVYVYQPPAKDGDQADYKTLQGDYGQHVICNGKAIFAFDYGRKRLTETQLPPDIQGEAINHGPLPFLFGAKAAEIKQRYWLRVITPPNVQGEYWLEAVPKTQADAANYKMVHIIIEEKQYLPKAIILFDRNFDAVRKPARTTFLFENRVVNPALDQINKLSFWHRDFYDPKLPKGWSKVVERYQPPATGRMAPNRLEQTSRSPRGPQRR